LLVQLTPVLGKVSTQLEKRREKMMGGFQENLKNWGGSVWNLHELGLTNDLASLKGEDVGGLQITDQLG